MYILACARLQGGYCIHSLIVCAFVACGFVLHLFQCEDAQVAYLSALKFLRWVKCVDPMLCVKSVTAVSKEADNYLCFYSSLLIDFCVCNWNVESWEWKKRFNRFKTFNSLWTGSVHICLMCVVSYFRRTSVNKNKRPIISSPCDHVTRQPCGMDGFINTRASFTV